MVEFKDLDDPLQQIAWICATTQKYIESYHPFLTKEDKEKFQMLFDVKRMMYKLHRVDGYPKTLDEVMANAGFEIPDSTGPTGRPVG